MLRHLLPLLPLSSIFIGLALTVVWKERRELLADAGLLAAVALGAWLVWGAVSARREAGKVRRHRERVEALAAFARSLQEGNLQAPGFFGAGAAVVAGVRRGRRVWLLIQRQQVVLGTWVQRSAASFDLRRPTLPDRLGRALAGQAGRSWQLERGRGPAPGALARADVERALGRLFQEHGVTRVALGATLSAERPLRDADLDLAALEAVFDLLAQVAAPFDRREVADRAALERSFAWTGGRGGALRCPYCRDDLSLDDERLAPCGACRTLHHVDCLDEAGGCTVMGCEAGPERSSRRRRVEA